MPMQLPVFRRELANQMYTPSTYFWGRFLSNLLIQIPYPVLYITCMYWGLGIEMTYYNYLSLVIYAILINYISCAQGYFAGILGNSYKTAV